MKKKTRKQTGIENFGNRYNQRRQFNAVKSFWDLMKDKNFMDSLSKELDDFDANQKVIPFNVDREWPESIIAFNKEYALTYSGYEKEEAEHYIWPWLHDLIMLMYHIETIYADGTIIIDARKDKNNELTTEKIDKLVDDICLVINSGNSIRAFRDKLMEKMGLVKVCDNKDLLK